MSVLKRFRYNAGYHSAGVALVRQRARPLVACQQALEADNLFDQQRLLRLDPRHR
jgi:hypothetical protein